MTPTFSLIGRAFEIFFKKKNFVYILKITLVQILIGIGTAIPAFIISFILGGLSYGISFSNESSQALIFGALAILSVVSVIAMTVLGAWLNATGVVAFSRLVNNDIIGVGETLKIGWKKMPRFFLVNFFAGLLIVLGFILFVAPGIILAVWFSFSQFYAIEEDLGAMESIQKSKNLVKGRFLRVTLRYVVFAILLISVSVLLSFVPVVGSILMVFLGPFGLLLSYLLFVDLKHSREA